MVPAYFLTFTTNMITSTLIGVQQIPYSGIGIPYFKKMELEFINLELELKFATKTK